MVLSPSVNSGFSQSLYLSLTVLVVWVKYHKLNGRGNKVITLRLLAISTGRMVILIRVLLKLFMTDRPENRLTEAFLALIA